MSPSISDGRDLTTDLVGGSWSPMLTLKDLILQIPNLISNALKNPLCGNFRVGFCYELSLWNTLFEIYFCKEHFMSRKTADRILILTDNTFLLFEPTKTNNNLAVLVAWGFLCSLIRIMVMDSNILSLLWIAKGDNDNAWEQILEVENKEKLIKEIAIRMQRLDQIRIMKYNKQLVIEEDEVTMKSIMNMDINAINETMALYESSLELEPSFSKFQTLILLYQKVHYL
jgi:hypothetical protein